MHGVFLIFSAILSRIVQNHIDKEKPPGPFRSAVCSYSSLSALSFSVRSILHFSLCTFVSYIVIISIKAHFN